MKVNREELNRFNGAMERLLEKTEEMWLEADIEGEISLSAEQVEALLGLFDTHSQAVNSLFYAKANLKQLEEVFNQLVPTEKFLNILGDNGTQG